LFSICDEFEAFPFLFYLDDNNGELHEHSLFGFHLQEILEQYDHAQ